MLVSPGGRQRRWSLALLAVLVTVGAALAFVVLWMNAGDREPVLVAARNIAAGQTISAEDVKVVRLAADPGVDPIPASRRDDVIDQPAATDLLAGTVLIGDHVGEQTGLQTGTAVIAIPVPVSELPSSDVQPGDRLKLFVTAAPGDPNAGDAELIGDGRVFAVQAGEEGATAIRVSITVDEDLVPAVAAAIQGDRIYLALVATD
ncbi:MAG: SAF domain-containing protein [Acidimicrobiales bacterium]